MSDQEKEYKRLRSYLNPAIRGRNTDAILNSLAQGSLHLINNVEAVNDSLYIVKAEDKYLDSRLADRDIVRPDSVGLSDEVFRKLGIQVVNRKQVRDLILQILEVVYGEELTRASVASTNVEPYQLFDGDSLKIGFDDESQLNHLKFWDHKKRCRRPLPPKHPQYFWGLCLPPPKPRGLCPNAVFVRHK